jgi:hypothetical protein
MLVLALIIVLVSGLIAYVGDLVGRKMGRKRLTLFGLRPRYTAIVISVSVGMLIALLSLLATMAVSRQVREAFFIPIGNLKQEIVNLQKSRDEAREHFDEQSQKLVSTHQLLTSIVSQRTQIEGQLRESEQKLQAERVEQGKARAQLQLARGEYRRVSQDLRASQAQVGAAKTQIKTVSDHLFAVDKTVKALEDRKLLLEEAFGDYSTAYGAFIKSNFTPVSFTFGQEILTGLAPGASTPGERRAWLQKFLAVAEHEVRERSVNLPHDAAPILFIKVNADQISMLRKDEALDALAKRIGEVKGDDGVILRLAPVNNVPINGPAIISITQVELLPCQPAFLAGSEIAQVEMSIGPQTSTAEILGMLADNLLRGAVPTALRARQVVSISRRFDPAHTVALPGTASETISWAELMAAVEKAQSCRGKVRLLARSRTTVTTYGPVQIDLDVAPSP